MTFTEAIKSGLPLCRKDHTHRYSNTDTYAFLKNRGVVRGWIDPNYLLESIQLTKEDILADDWIVKFGDIYQED